MGVYDNNDACKREIIDLIGDIGITKKPILAVGDGYPGNTIAGMYTDKPVIILNPQGHSAIPTPVGDATYTNITGKVSSKGELRVISVGKMVMAKKTVPMFLERSALIALAVSMRSMSINIETLLNLDMEKGMHYLGTNSLKRYLKLMGYASSVQQIVVPEAFDSVVKIGVYSEKELKMLANLANSKTEICPIHIAYHENFVPYGQREPLSKTDIICNINMDTLRKIFKTSKIASDSNGIGARVYSINRR